MDLLLDFFGSTDPQPLEDSPETTRGVPVLVRVVSALSLGLVARSTGERKVKPMGRQKLS